MKKFKSGIILLIGMLFLIVINSNVVLGANDEFEQLFPTSNSSNTQSIDDEEEEDEEEEEDDDDANNTNSSIGSFITLNSTNSNNSNSSANNTSVSSNRSVSNNSTLAKTGINDFSGISAVIITICVISAIYSLKKFSEYKNM